MIGHCSISECDQQTEERTLIAALGRDSHPALKQVRCLPVPPKKIRPAPSHYMQEYNFTNEKSCLY